MESDAEPETTAVLITLPREMHTKFKKKCADLRVHMTVKGRELIQRFLDGGK